VIKVRSYPNVSEYSTIKQQKPPTLGDCHGSGYECWIDGYLGIVLGGSKELVLRKGGDVERRGNGVRML